MIRKAKLIFIRRVSQQYRGRTKSSCAKRKRAANEKKRKLQTVSFNAHRILTLGERAILLFPAFPEVLDICSTSFLCFSGFPVVPGV
jgi:hypothetical protein